MKIKRALSAAVALCVLLTLTGCGTFKKISSGEKTLRVGVEHILGSLNPFYCNNSADEIAISQMFQSIQYPSTGGKLQNYCGNITYEENGDSVKYTVNINSNMKFSDGANVTIDDVIFFYYFVADATYSGIYSDWFKNDIKGLKEYYYDDADYAASLAEIEETISENYTKASISKDALAQYLAETSVEGLWSGDLDAASPYSGSWRDYLDKAGYSQGLDELGDSPTKEKLLEFVAEALAETNPESYDCEAWWRQKLLSEYISGNYENGMNITNISGIKKINDYACTVEFNSHNMNAISSLNVPVVSKSFYAAEYQKGNAAAVKEASAAGIGSGPYALREFDEEAGVLTLVRNPYYYEGKSGFDIIEFIDLAANGANPAESIANGDVDIIEVSAEEGIIGGLDEDETEVSVFDRGYYSAFFFNTATVDFNTRCAISCLGNCSDILTSKVGSYFTLLNRGMSMRFYDSAPANQKALYTCQGGDISPQLKSAGYEIDASGKCLKDGAALSLDLYCSEQNDAIETEVINYFVSELKNNGVECRVVRLPDAEFKAAVKAGEADIWFDRVYDSATADKYEYYHTGGSMNNTGISDEKLDMMLEDIRQNAGGSGYADLQQAMLDCAAALAFEIPLYQRKNATVFSSKTIDPDSIPGVSGYSGMKYAISRIEPAQ